MPRKPTSPVTVGLAALTLAGTLYVATTSVMGAPALGPLLDPLHGVWALARTATPPAVTDAQITALSGPVDIRFDDRGVPHIFATTVLDAVRGLGYVHARDRLFQLELQTRAVAGTVAELAGDRALPLDREARAQGLADAATRAFDALAPDSRARLLANAYADGVQAYIGAMPRDALPFEYRLLGAEPQMWEPKYTAYLLARMGLTLAYSDGELRRAAVEALVGAAATDALFPRNSPLQEPIQPNGQRAPRADFGPIPPPAPSDPSRTPASIAMLEAARAARQAFAVVAGGSADDTDPLDDVAVGSNNWAVGPKRSASGHALLAGDPHLSLTLPSIWYEAHLVVPDSLDVYGVTLVGAPLPVIGFTRNVAWSATNTGADVADYYVETVDDSLRPRKYQLDGAWKPLRERVEVIRGKGGRVIATDTILETHRGPMLKSGGRWVSRRWTVTDAYDAVSPFLDVARAKNAREIWAALDGFHAPAQNFVSADREGHIALRSTGHYPIRPSAAPRGDVVIDGAKSANDWQGFWPVKDYPQAFDPAQGFVVSANQQPKDPRVDPRYLGWDWPSPWRAMRLNELLREDSAVTPDKMRRMQTDPVSSETRYFLPAFLGAAEADGRDSVLARAAAHLRQWDGRFTAENTQAIVFETALSELTSRTWDELSTGRGSDRGRLVEAPQAVITAQLMADPDSPWWDDRATPTVRERRDDILRASLAAAWTRTVARLGQPGPGWRWGELRRASVRHLLGIPALSRPSVPLQAGPGSVSPSSGTGNHGASWRMVVELGPEVRAWGTYPGGQSGNPISPSYTAFLGKWSAGTLDSLRFPRRPDDLTTAATSSRVTLRGTP